MSRKGAWKTFRIGIALCLFEISVDDIHDSLALTDFWKRLAPDGQAVWKEGRIGRSNYVVVMEFLQVP